MARDVASLDARLAELRALTPAPREGIHPVSDEAATTARRIGRLMLALGHHPVAFPGPDDDVPTGATHGGCTVETAEADVYITADGRVRSVVTLAEGDDDDDG
jgi:hypothetical protein